MLEAGDGHRLYFEQCGNPQGLPVVVLHGGPGSGCSSQQRRFFDPAVFRIVLFDQRGCGRSTPRGSLANNDTPALVRDIEQLREELGIARWIVFGGSWGASLAIAYASSHLTRSLGLVLRGTFLTGSRDLDWFFGGAGTLLPSPWLDLVARIGLPVTIAECEHAGHAVLAMLSRRLASDEPAVAGATARAWSDWEDVLTRRGIDSPAGATSHPSPPAGIDPHPPAPGPATPAAGQQMLIDKYRVQVHYLTQQCFLGEETLLRHAARLSSVPVQVVHGRLDWVCRPGNAWQVHRAIATSELTWVDLGGHSPYDPPMLRALAAAIGRIRERVGR